MRIALLFTSFFLATTLLAQKTKTNTAKIDFTHYPTIPVEGMKSLGVMAYTGDMAFNKDTLRLYLGNVDMMKSNVERMSKVEHKALQDVTLVGGEGDITIEMAFGESSVISKELKTASCMVAKDGCTQYYYALKYSLPAVVQAKNSSGIVNTWELNPVMELQFGNEQIEKHVNTEEGSVTSIQVITYTSEADLALAFSDEGESSLDRKAIVTQLGNLAESIYHHAFFEETTLKLDIAYGNGGAGDYSETENASDKAVSALEKGDYASLQGPIAIWESWLLKYEPEDKKALVNKKVAQGLHENLAIAYTFTKDFAEARKHLEQATDFSQTGNVNVNEVNKLKEFRSFINDEENAAKYNSSLKPTTFVDAPDIKKIIGRRKFNKDLDFLIAEDKYEEIAANHAKMGPAKDISEMTVEEFMNQPAAAEDVAGEVSIEGRVENDMLILSGLVDAGMRGKAFPVAICDYPNVKTIRAVNIGFTSFPECMSTLVNLEKLLIGSNDIEALPDFFGSMKKLEVLDISNNNLKLIPESLFGLSGLKKVMISGNQFPDADVKRLKDAFPDVKFK